MNKNFHSNRDDALLDAVLADEAWTAAEAAGKHAALAEFHATHRQRKLRIWLAQAAAVLLLAAGAVWWPRTVTPAGPAKVADNISRKGAPPVQVSTPAVAPFVAQIDSVPVNEANYISEEELLALFPKGSCTIVEVDGQKELIFFDRKVEHEGAVYRGGGFAL